MAENIVIQQYQGTTGQYQELWPKTNSFTKEESASLYDYKIGDVKLSCNGQDSNWQLCNGSSILEDVTESTKNLIDPEKERWSKEENLKKNKLTLPTSWATNTYVYHSNMVSTSQWKYVFCAGYRYTSNRYLGAYVFYSNDLIQWNTLTIFSGDSQQHSVSDDMIFVNFNDKLYLFLVTASHALMVYTIESDCSSFSSTQLDNSSGQLYLLMAKVVGNGLVCSYRDSSSNNSSILFMNSSLQFAGFQFPSSYSHSSSMQEGALAYNICEIGDNYQIIAVGRNRSHYVCLYTIPKIDVVYRRNGKKIAEGTILYSLGVQQNHDSIYGEIIGDYLYLSINTSIYRTIASSLAANSSFEVIGENLSQYVNLTNSISLTCMGEQVIMGSDRLLFLQNGKITKEFQFFIPSKLNSSHYWLFNGFVKAESDLYIKGITASPYGEILYTDVNQKVPNVQSENWKYYIKVK